MTGYPCCCDEGGAAEACGNCEDGGETMPETVSATLTGFADQDCNDCLSLNATFVLDENATCEYRYAGTDVLCSFGAFTIDNISILLLINPTEFVLAVTLAEGGLSRYTASFTKSRSGTSETCSGVHSLTLDSEAPTMGDIACDASGVSASVTI